jgi:hypothetical protein
MRSFAIVVLAGVVFGSVGIAATSGFDNETYFHAKWGRSLRAADDATPAQYECCGCLRTSAAAPAGLEARKEAFGEELFRIKWGRTAPSEPAQQPSAQALRHADPVSGARLASEQYFRAKWGRSPATLRTEQPRLLASTGRLMCTRQDCCERRR